MRSAAALGTVRRASSRSAGATGRGTASPARHPPLELHLGGFLAARRRLEVGFLLEAADGRDQAAREQPDPGVVVAHRLAVAHALDRDAVLGALELALERQEILVGFELGIALDGDEQPPECAAQLGLGLLELLKRGGVVDQLGRGLDAGHAGPRLGDLLQHGALLGREALDGLDQVRHEIGAALVDVLHLRPLLVDELLLGHELVVDADGPADAADDDEDDHAEDDQSSFHAGQYTSLSEWARAQAARRSMTAAANASVPSVPPRSRVLQPAASARL